MDKKETRYENWCNFFTENHIPIVTSGGEGYGDKMIVTGSRCQGTCSMCFILGSRYADRSCLLYPLLSDIVGYTLIFSPAGKLKRIIPNKPLGIEWKKVINLGFSQRCEPIVNSIIDVLTVPKWKDAKIAYDLAVAQCAYTHPELIPSRWKIPFEASLCQAPKRRYWFDSLILI